MTTQTETKSETLSVRCAPETLSALRDAAESDGRPVEDVVEDAMRAYLDERRNGGGEQSAKTKRNVRPEVMAHFRDTVRQHRKLLELLAQ